jgi:hypothetical protein
MRNQVASLEVAGGSRDRASWVCTANFFMQGVQLVAIQVAEKKGKEKEDAKAEGKAGGSTMMRKREGDKVGNEVYFHCTPMYIQR